MEAWRPVNSRWLKSNWKRGLGYAAMASLGLALFVISLLIWKFPFRRSAVVTRIERGTGAHVEIGKFRTTWFPPGFTAAAVRLSNGKGDILTLESVGVTGSYGGLVRTPAMIPGVYATGVQLIVAADHPAFFQPGHANSSVAVGEIRLQNARLDVISKTAGKEPLTFLIRRLALTTVGQSKPTAFHVLLHNPIPSGDIRSDGQFGPFNIHNPEQTPISGVFSFERADLNVQRAISGVLNASGRFLGPFSALKCTGTADVPQFQVFGSSHTVHIASRFDATVDARTGDTLLHEVVSHFNGTTVLASGRVSGVPETRGKTVTLDMAVHDGRVEDLLLLFTRGDRAAMKGPIDLTGKFTIPPGPPGFLTRLKMKGSFVIAGGRFTNQTAQAHINRLSESAAGESKREQADDPTVVPLNIRASVSDRNGVAALPHILVEAPGIRGQLNGTFKLRGSDINLNGILRTTGKLSDTTTGVKTLMLKALGPLWPRKASVQSIPFEINGKASHPVFRIKLHS